MNIFLNFDFYDILNAMSFTYFSRMFWKNPRQWNHQKNAYETH